MFDAHTHLQDERFDACREAAIEAALAAGVTGACCCGSSAEDWRAVGRLANAECGMRSAECGLRGEPLAAHPLPAALSALRIPSSPLRTPHSAFRIPDSAFRVPRSTFFIRPAFGVHPWYAGEQPADWMAQLEEHLTRHPEAPVGEIGIDGLRDNPPREKQRQVLIAQLELAVRVQRPVVLHGARAWGELLAIIKPFAARLPGFVAHAFSGSKDILREVVAMGGYVSFAGPVCNPAARRVRAAAVATPVERLLIETDAPDLNPAGQKTVDGGRWTAEGIPAEVNHPANLVYVANAVAELRGLAVEEVAAVTTANARRVYRIADGVR